MVVFNECRIDPEGKYLIIEASVDNLSYYEKVYIDSVIVDTDETFSANGPSENPVYKQVFEQGEEIPEWEECKCKCCCKPEVGVKHIRLRLCAKDLNLSTLDNNIFFVYIFATGYPTENTPCGMDNSYVMGVAVNLRPIYNMAMGYIKELSSTCSIPKGFIDMILRLKAFELALRTGNYTTAFLYWNRLFKNKVSVSTKRGCGCNGIN